MSRLQDTKDQRLEKIEKLRKLGVNPFAHKFDKKHLISKSRELLGTSTQTAGRVMSVRGHGALIFMDLVDETGKIQLILRQDNLNKKDGEIISLIDIGDIVGVSGKVIESKTEEISIDVNSFTLLTKSLRPLPSQWHGLKDIEERYRQRYVDLLINPDVRKVFDTRTRLLSYFRKYLDNHGFSEVETPILQPIYGGATAKPFTTFHNALKANFYLRIANELYLKRLIVGGYEKVYEVSKDFRNEGIDRQHNPEFTQIEFYWAYADYNDLMDLSEDMLSKAVKEVAGSYQIIYQGRKINFKPPWKRITFRRIVLKDTNIDIDKVVTETDLLKTIKEKKIKIDLKGITGYANVLDELYKTYSRPKIKGPVFLIDHPYEAKPLAKRKPDEPSKVASVALLISGFEVFNAYSELNNPVDQKARWEEEKKLADAGFEEAQMMDEDYIRALEYGMPPTAGWGMGIDRFTAIITDSDNLKDTIIFPTLKPKK
ncbi:lysine--tRNA ligase [Patescibacteria group bacterium]|nr:lysine--tRNA ligase [Patescibacteria group bacterium]MBU1256320.1 lysine--tRNA ligase [Patescibacteria group bacterium]MBU1457078.1 lysine--tRNA ligase [Patescibacteria group bacterium]